MPSKAIIRKQFDYNNWANEKIFAQSGKVSREDFNAPSVVEGRSLQQVLAHMVRIEKVWRLLARDGNVDPAHLPSEQQLSSIESIQDFSRQEHEKMMTFLEELPEENLPEPMQVRRWDGVQVTMVRSDMLVHLALHSMQHRTEAAVLLTQYGYSPGDLDYLFFAMRQKK